MKKTLLTGSLMLFAFGFSARADLNCVPCPQGTRLVALEIASAETDQEWRFRSADLREHLVPDGMADAGREIVDSPMALAKAIMSHANRCERIGYLKVSSHGTMGEVALGGSNLLNAGNLDFYLKGADCAMAPWARIAFNGCNVGRGCRGEDFLAQVARVLLPKGGSARAFTSYGVTIGGLGTASLNLENQTIQVEPGLISQRWEKPTQSAQACQSRALGALADLSKLEERVSNCQVETFTPMAFANVRRMLLKATADEALRAQYVYRTEFAPASSKRASDYVDAFREFGLLKDLLAGIGPCRGEDNRPVLRDRSEFIRAAR